MCSITGAIYKTEPDWSTLVDMHAHQHMRGPDGQGTWIDGNVSFAHNRLSLLDLSNNGRQPMETDRWVLTYNGEIYNYQKLKAKISPRQWKSYGDTETLLFYIDEHGIDQTLRDIEGMYAFSAYDKIAKKLYLCVDPFGIKPLYYFKTHEVFAFASAPAALTKLKPKWEINRDSLCDFLALGATFLPLFDGIKKVFGGQMVVYDAEKGTVLTTSYYQKKIYPEATQSDVIDVLKESIQSVKVADVPVFLFLSGGIDSTFVASQCKRSNAVHLSSPEERYAREVSEKYDNPFHLVDPQEFKAETCLTDYAKQSGDCSAASIIPYITSKQVSRLAKAAISANGADELFFGYDRIKEAPTAGQYNHIFREHFLKKGHHNDDLGSIGTLYSSWGRHSDWQDPRELELKTYVQFDLNKTLDFASMCHGLEVRVPFLNRSVVEMALSLPITSHCNGYGPKSILKKELIKEGFSESFVNRPKVGFSLHKEPSDYKNLKHKGMALLKNEFDINPVFKSGRDQKYFEAAAAAFFCWHEAWKHLF